VNLLTSIAPGHPEYPLRLGALTQPPRELTIAGAFDPAFVIAIVGTRECSDEAASFTRELAGAAARRGAVIISGGARGIDAAAHRGALDAKGRTWLVAPCGSDHVYPNDHRSLYEDVIRGGGALLYPFPHTQQPRSWTFHMRNEVLVALADVVVVAQSPAPSGTLNAAKHARALDRPLWVVPGPPWDAKFTGSCDLLDKGARPLTSIPRFLDTVGGRRARQLRLDDLEAAIEPQPETMRLPKSPLDAQQRALFEATSTDPRHLDEIAARARVCTAAAATGLLTLALENVVVEGPDGFFRRGLDP
jgi:DNA processing protein